MVVHPENFKVLVSLWCLPVCKISVEPTKRQCSATVIGFMITHFHAKNGVFDMITAVLNEDPLLDTQGVTGSSPVSPNDVSRCTIKTYGATEKHFTSLRMQKLVENVSLVSSTTCKLYGIFILPTYISAS